MKPAVLIVDDVADFRMIMERVVSKKGLEPLSAHDGDEAWALFQEHHERIVCVFSDMSMPGTLDGLALARNIRAHGSTIPFILLSGKPQDTASFGLDPIEQLIKPVPLKVLRAKLTEITSL